MPTGSSRPSGEKPMIDPNAADPNAADPHAHPHPADRAHPADRELPAYGTGHELQHAAHHAAVVLSGVTAGYEDRAALTDVSVAVAAGTLLAVFGPNGGEERPGRHGDG